MVETAAESLIALYFCPVYPYADYRDCGLDQDRRGPGIVAHTVDYYLDGHIGYLHVTPARSGNSRACQEQTCVRTIAS